MFSNLFARHPLPMVLLRARGFDVLAANDAAVFRYGYEHDELIALPGLHLWHEDDRARFATTLEHLSFAAPVGSTRWRHRHKSGAVFEVDLHAVELGSGPAWLVLAAPPGMAAAQGRNLAFTALEVALRRAIERFAIDVAYQPIFDLVAARTVGIEALARWHDPERGHIAPDVFIPLAEATGLIGALGRSVLERSCARMRALIDAGHRGLHICVNVAAPQLADSRFASDVIGVLAENDLDASALVLEMTESAYIGGYDVVLANLTMLRTARIRIALDDFGTGYSALGYLKRLPVDALKIDRSFIADILTNETDLAITRAIIAVAASLGLDAIAEGVEAVEQVDLLRQLGCRYVQGHLLARPLCADDLDAYLARERAQPLRMLPGLRTG